MFYILTGHIIQYNNFIIRHIFTGFQLLREHRSTVMNYEKTVLNDVTVVEIYEYGI